jgi:hypothetical protein
LSDKHTGNHSEVRIKKEILVGADEVSLVVLVTQIGRVEFEKGLHHVSQVVRRRLKPLERGEGRGQFHLVYRGWFKVD